MDKSALIHQVATRAAGYLGGQEFVFDRESSLIRRFDGGRQTVGVTVWDHSPEFHFTFMVMTRHDSVEKMFHLFSGSPTEHYQSLSETIMTPLSYFVPLDKLSVRNATDIDRHFDILGPILNDRIGPFLNNTRDIRSLDTILDSNDQADITVKPYNFMHRIVIAKMARNPRFEEIAAAHIEALNGSRSLEQYARLLDHVRSNV